MQLRIECSGLWVQFKNVAVPLRQTTPLYDQDFYAWTQRQAELLRAGHLGRLRVAALACWHRHATDPFGIRKKSVSSKTGRSPFDRMKQFIEIILNKRGVRSRYNREP